MSATPETVIPPKAATAPPSSSSADSALAAVSGDIAHLAKEYPQAEAAQKELAVAQTKTQEGVNQYEITRDEQLEQQYNDALQHANAIAQRQRYLTLNITKGIWKFMPIAVAFGLLASKETGGNVAAGFSTMMQGLAGYANGRYDQYKEAYAQWQDSLNDARTQVKDITDRVKEIMSHNGMDLGSRIEQLKLETLNYPVMQKAAMSGDPAKIAKTLTDMTNAITKFDKAMKGPSKKANPNVSGDLKATALQAVEQLIPMPKGSGGGAMTSVEQSISPDYAAWYAKVYPLAKQLAIASQAYVVDGMSNAQAVLSAVSDLTKQGLLKPGTVRLGLNTRTYAAPQPSSAPSGVVAIGGKNYSMASIAAAAKKRGWTTEQYIAAARKQAGE